MVFQHWVPLFLEDSQQFMNIHRKTAGTDQPSVPGVLMSSQQSIKYVPTEISKLQIQDYYYYSGTCIM